MSLSEWLALLGGILAVIGIIAASTYHAGTAFLALVLAAVSGMSSCSYSEHYAVTQAATAKAEQAERTPHVIREVDGCKVYAFKANDLMHYFTRCPSQVTTEGAHQERRGKTTVTVTESIVTGAH